jgi:hypothetical protein
MTKQLFPKRKLNKTQEYKTKVPKEKDEQRMLVFFIRAHVNVQNILSNLSILIRAWEII